LDLRDADTLDDVGVATAPTPVEVGDVVATREMIFRIETVLSAPITAACLPVLVHRFGRDTDVVGSAG
jgi:hypothetical protein